MTRQSGLADFEDSGVALAFEALLAEYKATREALLACDEIIVSLEGFTMLILSTALTGLPFVLKEQMYVILPVLSLVVSAIGLARQTHTRSANALSSHERLLSKKLLALINHANGLEHLPSSLQGLWQRPSYHPQQHQKSSSLSRVTRRLARVRLGPLYWAASTGFLGLFVFLRGLQSLMIWEAVIFCLASIYCIWMILVHGSYFAVHLYNVARKNDVVTRTSRVERKA